MGLEPTTTRLKAGRSSYWANSAEKVHPMRIELMTSGLWDLRSTNWAKGAVRYDKDFYSYNFVTI